MESQNTILLIECEKSYAELIKKSFADKTKYKFVQCDNIKNAEKHLSGNNADIIIADIDHPHGCAIDFIKTGQITLHHPVAVISNSDDAIKAVDMMRAGAMDYIVKSESSLKNLPRTMDRILREWNNIIIKRTAEKKLQANEERYRLLAENAIDVLWTSDMNLNWTFISPSMKLLRGYTAGESMEQSIDMMLTPDSLSYALDVFSEILYLEQRKKNSQKLRILELEYTCKDGSTVWTEVKASLIRDKEMNPIGIIGAVSYTHLRAHET